MGKHNAAGVEVEVRQTDDEAILIGWLPLPIVAAVPASVGVLAVLFSGLRRCAGRAVPALLEAVKNAKLLGKVAVIGTFPEDSHKPIIYPAAVLAASTAPDAQAFLDDLSTEAAGAIFTAQGFIVLK